MKLSTQELETVRNICDLDVTEKFIRRRAEDKYESQNYTNPIYWNGDENFIIDGREIGIDGSLLKKIITPKLKEEIGNFTVSIAFVLEALTPYHIHTDANENHVNPKTDINSDAYKVCLIPLTSGQHTVLFNETSTTNVWDYFEQNIPDYAVDEEFYEKHLTHLDKDCLKWLTPKAVAEWNEGEAIIFDRKLLHCSSDFIKEGFKSKKALILFLEEDVDDN